MQIKSHSVFRVIVSLITLGILIYSFFLFLVIHKELNIGFQNFFRDDLEPQSVIINQEFNAVLTTLTKTVDYAKNTYEAQYDYYTKNHKHLVELSAYINKYFGTYSFCIFDEKGRQQTSLMQGIIHNNELIRRAIQGENIQEIYKEGSILFAIVGRPIYVDGKPKGAVVCNQEITTDSLINYIANYTNCDITVFNNTLRAFTNIPKLKRTHIEDPTPITRAQKGEKTLKRTKLNGEEYFALYFPLTDSRGNFITTLYMGRNLKTVKKVTTSIFTPTIISAIIFTIILLFVMILIFLRRIMAPLTKVGDAVANLSSGDADLTIRLPVKGQDEFAKLSSDVNQFIELLQGIVQKLRSAQESLTTIGRNLSQNAQDSASATTEIMSNIESVRKQSEHQSDAISNTSNVMDLASGNVSDLGNLIDNQGHGIANSSSAIEQMLGNISSVTDNIRKMSKSFEALSHTVNDGNQKMENVNQKVSQMSEQSSSLLQANEMISQVASQTNLLAMNAAIEAAHAGEAGKGFSVVADEIRKLAETSSAQSKAIDQELKSISGSIQDVVTLSQDSQQAFGAIVTSLDQTDEIIHQIDTAMTEQQTASHQILSSLNDMRTQSGDVSEKSKDLTKAVEEVNKDMQDVLQISATILGSMDEMAQGSGEIQRATQSVSDLAHETQDNIDTMNNLLNQFKV